MIEPEFLTTEDVLLIHAHQIAQFGGSDGIRDPGLLESAVAQAQASYGGEWVHGDLFEMAAAYHFHLVGNHAFIDGNKRIGLAAALVFLELNGIVIESGTDELYEITMSVARGELSKPEIASLFRTLVAAGGRSS